MHTDLGTPMKAFSNPRPLATSRVPLRVMLIDDDLFMLSVLEDLLHDFGVAIVTKAMGGTAAIGALQALSSPPDLLICDLNMPGGDGFQLMENLGAMGYGGQVALMSGMDDRTVRSAALMAKFHRLRIVGCLAKPIGAPALRGLLDHCA